MSAEKEMLSISEMAKLHKVSRQTLIHYDKIDLFKPEITLKNGYRYYSLRQIPVLREITFLRSLNVQLENIKLHMKNRTPDNVTNFFSDQIESLEREIQELHRKKQYAQSRLNTYKPYYEYQAKDNPPNLRHFAARKIIFIPFDNVDSRTRLHCTLMQAWRLINMIGYQPAYGFGAVIRHKSLSKGNILEGAGSYIVLPEDAENFDAANMLTLPAGDYITMFKYGKPYESKPLKKLLGWMEQKGYAPCGDIADSCIFDTTFHSNEIKEDFCQLQVPIRYD